MNYLRLLFLGIFLISIGCTNNKNENGETKLSPDAINNPQTASDERSKKKLPEFKFEKTNHAFGQIIAGEVVTHEFKFTNSGNVDLIINDVSSSCGCTVPAFSKEPIAPGGEGKIQVQFNSEGRTGMNSKTITVIANTIPNSKVLTISADVITN